MPGKKRGYSQFKTLEEFETTTEALEALDPLQEALHPLQKSIKIAKSYVPPPGSEPTSRDLIIPLVFECLNNHPGSDMAMSNVPLFGCIIAVLDRNIQVSESEIQSLRAQLSYRVRLAKRATLIASFLPGKRVCEEWQWIRPAETYRPLDPFEEERISSVYKAVLSVEILPEPKCGEGFFDPKIRQFLTQVFYDLNWKPSRVKQKLWQIKRIIDKATPENDLPEHISASAKSAVST